MPFNVIGVHFPGAVNYCKKHKEEVRAYVVVYLRSVLGIAYKSADLQVYEELEKLHCQKRMNFEGQQSDNSQTFVAAAKWLKTAQKDEEFHTFLSD